MYVKAPDYQLAPPELGRGWMLRPPVTPKKAAGAALLATGTDAGAGGDVSTLELAMECAEVYSDCD